MTRNPVFFLDSGIGGLPYVETARQLLPDESFFYLADRNHFPYGERDPEDLVNILREIIAAAMERYTPKALVLACNTASVVALADLRKQFSIPIIGVVPAVKPAAEQTENKRIGILATRRTVNDAYTENLIRQFAGDCVVFRNGAADIVELVETHYADFSDARAVELIGRAVAFFRQSGVDRLVLGCTHFLYLEEVLQRMLGDGIQLVDSRIGVARQLKRVLEANDLAAAAQGRNLFLHTGDGGFRSHYRTLAERYGFEYGGMVG